MKKKVFCFTLVCVLMVSFLASCTTTKTKVDEPTTAGTAVNTTKASSADASLILNNAFEELKCTSEPELYMSDIPNMTIPGVLPIVAKPVKLTLGIPENVSISDYEDNPLTKWFKEMSGVDIEFYFFPYAASDARQKFELLASSGSELPDFIIGVNLTHQSRNHLGASGLLLPLDAYFEKYTYFYNQNIVQEPEDIQNAIKKLGISPDGKLYGFPRYVNSPTDTISEQLNINKTWLDKLGLGLPTNTDEFYDVLKAFYEKDPNGNNKADEIPLIGSINSAYDQVDTPILNMFIYMNPDGLLVDNGKISAAFVQDDYKDAITYLNKLCSENLLSPLSFTNKRDQTKPLVNPPEGDPLIVGCFACYPHLIFSQSIQDDRKRDYVGLPLMTGPSGKAYATYRQPTMEYNGYITKYCQYPEIAFRILDFMTTQDWAYRARYGPRGGSWEYIEPGSMIPIFDYLGFKASKRTFLNPIGEDKNIYWGGHDRRWMGLAYYGSYAHELNESNPAETEAKYMEDQYFGISYLSRVGKQPKEIVGTLLYTEAETLEMAEMKSTIDTYVKESRINFILGHKNLTTDWNNYLKDLDKMGLKHYLEIVEAAYNRMNK